MCVCVCVCVCVCMCVCVCVCVESLVYITDLELSHREMIYSVVLWRLP